MDETSTVASASKDAVFQIGIAMSGAVSAGAYTAGVFDFLIEALDRWEERRLQYGAGTPEGGPAGRACIKTLVGASAGAITAGIGTIALAGPEKVSAGRYVLGRLHEAWVVKPTLMASAPGAKDLLSLDDLTDAEGRPVPPTSLLNSALLTAIGEGALVVSGAPRARPYVSAKLHVYMTLVDLRGTPYTIDFRGQDGYHMLSHASRAHFSVAGLGSWTTTSSFADDDPGTSLDTATLFATPSPPEAWSDFATAAIGSAAFPIGLAPRLIRSQYGPVKFPIAEGDAAPRLVDTAFDRALFKDEQPFSYVAVDGGVLDNDPFQYARFTLMEDPPHPNRRSKGDADRAVLMVAPFPEAPPLIAEGQPRQALDAIAASVLSALRQQVRFKPDELLSARDREVFSRFMISPVRTADGETRRAPYTIASGLLGGFGGFVAEPFREHDYQLGRRNCQQFLRSTFVLPASRAYFGGWSGPSRDAALVRSGPDATGQVQDMLPIVPLFDTAATDVPLLDWPRLSRDGFEALMDRIERRYLAVARGTVAAGTTTLRIAGLLRIGLMIGRDRITAFLRWTILSDLILRDQIEGYELGDGFFATLRLPADLTGLPSLPFGLTRPADFVRAVLAGLASPSADFRTAAGIARSLHADDPAVVALIGRVLEGLATLDPGRPAAAWKAPWTTAAGAGALPVYTLASRRPSAVGGWFRNLARNVPSVAPRVD